MDSQTKLIVPQRSRSKTRSNESSKGESNEALSRDHSLQRTSRENSLLRDGVKKKFSRNTSELLHTAITQNHRQSWACLNSSNIILEKNKDEPMTNDAKRPQFKIWNTFNAVEKEVLEAGNSVSPLTVLQDQYDIRRPQDNGPILSNPDNSFKSLLLKAQEEEQTQEAKIKIPDSSVTNGLYNRMSQMVNSMYSLAPMNSNFKECQPSINSGNITNYQSESDDDGDSDEELNELEPWNTPSTEHLSLLSPKDFTDVLNVINEFQNNFVNRYDQKLTKDNISTSNVKFSRIQQRVLDYKELYSSESPSINLLNSASIIHPNSSASSHNIKIQYDTIINQYTSIRLRFASKLLSFKNQLKSNTGVLGFINRINYLSNIKGNDVNGDKFWFHNCASDCSDKSNDITFDNKDEYLKNLWDNEFNTLFCKNDNQANIEEPFSNNDENNDSYNINVNFNMSDLAKNVRLST